MVIIEISRKIRFNCTQSDLQSVQNAIRDRFFLAPDEYYLVINGRRVIDKNVIGASTVHVVPKVVGGKGGFGSMLRAIGAQIEKTTNREACRDLSGRRLRDINEEKKLKKWMASKKERENNLEEQRRKKMEKILEGPQLGVIDDKEFFENRSQLPEKLEEAINEGLKQTSSATTSTSGEKRPNVDTERDNANKKRKLWLDHDDDNLSLSSSDTDNDGDDLKKN